jgi:hypothetical protein
MDYTFRQMEVHDRALWPPLRAELWWRPITKELNEFLERGNFWGSLPNYRTVSLQASRKSLFAVTPTVPSAARSPFSRGLDTAAISPSTPGRAPFANGGIIFGFPWLCRTRFRRLYRRSRVPRGTCGLSFKETEPVVHVVGRNASNSKLASWSRSARTGATTRLSHFHMASR